MKQYKSSERVRNRALTYYAAHRAEVLVKMEAGRRARGIPVKVPARTDAEKLATVTMCTCGRQITTPSLLKGDSRRCLRCCAPDHFTKEGARLRSQQHRASTTNGFGKFQAWKAKQVCKDCGVPWTKDQRLDFHHRDPSTKKFRISRGVHRVSAARLWAEIAKCDLLCRACHEGTHGYKIFTQRSHQ